jgi:hypothetical protein
MKTKQILELCTGLFFIIFILSLQSCGIYSFTGASLPPEIKTFSIKTFSNQASLVVPSLAENMTEKLKDKFLKEMNLKLVDDNADLNFTGMITEYKTTPSGIISEDRAATTRLTITVQVKFENTRDAKASFETSFSNFAEFNSTLDFASVQNDLNDQIIEKLIQDIFNRSVNNW